MSTGGWYDILGLVLRWRGLQHGRQTPGTAVRTISGLTADLDSVSGSKGIKSVSGLTADLDSVSGSKGIKSVSGLTADLDSVSGKTKALRE